MAPAGILKMRAGVTVTVTLKTVLAIAVVKPLRMNADVWVVPQAWKMSSVTAALIRMRSIMIQKLPLMTNPVSIYLQAMTRIFKFA